MLAALWTALAAGAQPAVAPLVFGVLNQQSPLQTAERWNPLLHYLTRKTGIPLRLKMGPTIEETDSMLGREEFDLAFTNHNFQPEFDGRYQVLVKWAGRPIHGVIVVPVDSPIRNLEGLQGRSMAFPSADSFVAYAVPDVALREAGVTVARRLAGNQEGALAQLRAGLVDAAAVNSRFLEAYAHREQLEYRKIYVSAPYPELPVIIHPRIPAEQRLALRRAMLEMRQDPDAATVLDRARCSGFEPAEEREYDGVRRIYRRAGK